MVAGITGVDWRGDHLVINLLHGLVLPLVGSEVLVSLFRPLSGDVGFVTAWRAVHSETIQALDIIFSNLFYLSESSAVLQVPSDVVFHLS